MRGGRGGERERKNFTEPPLSFPFNHLKVANTITSLISSNWVTKQIKFLVNQLLLVRWGKLMLRRFIFIANRSYAWITSCVSAFCVLSTWDGRMAMASQWLSESPASGERAKQASGKQGSLDRSEQKVSTLGPCYISAASAQFQGTNLLSYPDRQWNRSTKGSGINLYVIAGRKWSMLCPKIKVLGVQSWKKRYSHCLCFTYILVQPLFLWHVTAELQPPPRETHFGESPGTDMPLSHFLKETVKNNINNSHYILVSPMFH